ncbi:MAG: Hpt domain-containing protein [Flavobacteriales bacterium]
MNKHYSKDNLKAIADNDPDFMVIIAQTFLEEIPTDLNALQEAITNNNKDLAYQFAHKMKPNIEMLGIEVFKDLKTIEDWTKTSKRVEAVNTNIKNVVSILNHVFNELKSDFDL